MQTESSFNPYAISYANAIGLMQVVPRTAGRDVFAMKGKSGQPSERYLYDPANNIDSGVSYLWLLQNQYLDGITNPTSKRFAMISAYNSGAGAVLRVFDNDKELEDNLFLDISVLPLIIPPVSVVALFTCTLYPPSPAYIPA